MAALLNVKQFVRFDEHGNLNVPNKLLVACQAHVQTPLLGDNSNRVATTEWVRAQLTNVTGVSFSETDPIWASDKTYYYTKLQSDARYLQSFTETDPTVPAWAKTSVKPTYTFAELLSKPTTIAGYGITDIPTTLPASDVYAWAKAATKPSYAYSEITGLPALFSGVYADLTGKPTLFSGSYTDLTNKPTIPTYTLSGLGGQPLDADLTAIAALAGTAGFLKKTAADTWALDNSTYLTSYTETDPIWTAEKTNYALKTYVDTSISNLVASAPATLDTLNELALALGSDANFSTTIATSIGNKVPYTGATASVDLGNNSLISGNLKANGVSGLAGMLHLKNGTNLPSAGDGYASIGATPYNSLTLAFYNNPTNGKFANFNFNLLTDSTSRNYTFPDANGTLALTSDIPSLANYITLNGTQTITGNKTFSGINSFTGYTSFSYASTFMNGTSLNWTAAGSHTAGSLTLSSAHSGSTSSLILSDGDTAKYIYFSFINTATGTKTYILPDASGTLALTSNLSSYLPLSGGTLTGPLGGTTATLSSDLTVNGEIISNNYLRLAAGFAIANNIGVNSRAGHSNISVLLSTGQHSLMFWTNTDWSSKLVFTPSANRTFTFPNASGTIALTSDIPTLSGLGGELAIAAGTTSQYWRGDKSWQTLNSTAVGLGNVSNTAQVTTTYNSSLNSDSRNSRGVTRLYRRDDDSDYSVQTYWTGTLWRLYGYNGDTAHADVHVGYADSAGTATNGRYAYDSGLNGGSVGYKEPSALHVKYATDSLRTTYAEIGFYVRNYLANGSANKSMTFYWAGQAGQPTWLWGSNNGEDVYVWNPSNFSVNYATTAGSATDATKLPLAGGALTGNLTITGTTNAPLTLRAVEPYMDVVATGASNTAGVALYPTAGYDAAIGNFNGGSLNLVAAGYTIAKVTRNTGVIFYVGTTGPIQALGNNTSAYHTFVNSSSDNKSWDISMYGNDWILNESNVLPRLKVLAGGGVYADSFFEFSDKRFKTLVQENPDFVGIESITAKHYIKEGKEELGYYAQDFEGVLDSAILKDKDGTLSLSYRQVHTAKIAALEKRIAELEAKLK